MDTPPNPDSILSQKLPLSKAKGNPASEPFDLKKWMQDEKVSDRDMRGIVGPILERLRSEAVDRRIDNSANRNTSKDSNKDEVIKFLQQQDCDDCVLWKILYHSLDHKSKRGEGAVEARVTLCDLILQKDPLLAFEEPRDFKKRCNQNLKKMHHDLTFNVSPPTPFWKAAKTGNAKIIERMISHAKDFCRAEMSDPDKQIHDLVWNPWKEYRNDQGKTALKIAAFSQEAETEAGKLETLDILLKEPNIADTDDDTFACALGDGEEAVVARFLDAGCSGLFIKSNYIIQAMDSYYKAKKNAHSSAQTNEDIPEYKILQSLIGRAETLDGDKIKIAEMMIKLDLEDIWHERKSQWDRLLDTNCLLHFAVLYQKLSFVNIFLKEDEYASSVLLPLRLRKDMKDKIEPYPLWYNNNRLDKSDSGFIERKDTGSNDIKSTRIAIRKALVKSIVEQSKDMQELMHIFQASGEPVRELFFDISEFNSKTIRISEFIQSLIQHRDPKKPVLPLYEESIRYAEFPALDLKIEDRENFSYNNSFAAPYKEVFDVLDWLYKDKGVRSIMKLKVQDRLINPHNEVTIAENVERFEVKVLDWKILDLSISVFGPEAKETLKELHLYSSGKRAVISHWLGNEGLRTLTKACYIRNQKLTSMLPTANKIWETMTAVDCQKIRKEVEDKLNDLKKSEDSWVKVLEWDVESRFWNPSPGQVNLDEIAQKLAPKLAIFLHNLKDLGRDEKYSPSKFRRTKVAIIENGILGITPRSSYNKPSGSGEERQFNDDKSLLSRVKDGCSFVDDHSKLGSWLFASDPHGTQMANLICAIDPLCDLYVAKVTEDKSGITNDRVARAIEWAINKDVDIISMSFALPEGSPTLQTQVEIASHDKRIIMVCSSHDEGEKTTEAWPASYRESVGSSIMVITASDEYGRELRKNGRPEHDYMIQGQKVWAGDIPFLDSRESPTGSSVSTAIAAGLSSLILTCDRMANHDRELANSDRLARVRTFLNEIKIGQSKFVVLEKLFGLDKHSMRPGGLNDARQILESKFFQQDRKPRALNGRPLF
ncbi:hypothetical protein F5884DRAFT_888196 [Xylogone sp. PMI_703]|nr:hypothetical protein F5884DRAFT_888196 [Xylogone sp. PMI_703]